MPSTVAKAMSAFPVTPEILTVLLAASGIALLAHLPSPRG
jgi:hypothetical protein